MCLSSSKDSTLLFCFLSHLTIIKFINVLWQLAFLKSINTFRFFYHTLHFSNFLLEFCSEVQPDIIFPFLSLMGILYMYVLFSVQPVPPEALKTQISRSSTSTNCVSIWGNWRPTERSSSWRSWSSKAFISIRSVSILNQIPTHRGWTSRTLYLCKNWWRWRYISEGYYKGMGDEYWVNGRIKSLIFHLLVLLKRRAVL